MKKISRSVKLDLDEQKLLLEIEDLRYRRRPAYWQIGLSAVIALATLSVAFTSGWTKLLEVRRDRAQKQLLDTQKELEKAKVDTTALQDQLSAEKVRLRDAQTAKTTLQNQLSAATARIDQIVREQSRKYISDKSSAQDNHEASLQANKAVQLSLATLQAQLNSTSKQVSDRKASPEPAAKPDISLKNKYAAAEALQQILERVTALEQEWRDDQDKAVQDMAAPYRMAPQPEHPPTELPAQSRIRLEQQDNDILNRYVGIAPSIIEIRSKALPYIKMTTGEVANDQALFEDADASARKKQMPLSVADVGHTRRFYKMKDYLTSLDTQLHKAIIAKPQ